MSDRNPNIGFESNSYQNLCQYGEIVVSLYENLCKYFAKYGKPFVYNEKMSMDHSAQILNLLERKRYITSLETDMENVAIKPLGYAYDIDNDFHYFHPNREHYE